MNEIRIKLTVWELMSRLRRARALPIPRDRLRPVLREIREELVTCVREAGHGAALSLQLRRRATGQPAKASAPNSRAA